MARERRFSTKIDMRSRTVALAGLLLGAALSLGFLPVQAATSSTTWVDPLADCPNSSGVMSSVTLGTAEPALQVSYAQSGNTFTFSVTTPSTPANDGVIEYCVFPTDSSGTPTGVIPSGTTWNIPPPPNTCTPPANWVTSSGGGYLSGTRATGTDNIPYDGSTTCALTINWGSSVGHFIIVLHVLDSTLCGGTVANPNTCYVIPNGTPHFPPPPPPNPVPEFPFGLALLVAVMLPALLLLRRQGAGATSRA